MKEGFSVEVGAGFRLREHNEGVRASVIFPEPPFRGKDTIFWDDSYALVIEKSPS